MKNSKLVPLLSRPALDKFGLSYPSFILSTNPLVYWPFNDLSGTAAVDRVAAHNGTYTGVNLAQSQPPFVAPLFDGANDCCNVYSSWLNTNWDREETSFAAWVKVYNAAVWSDGVARRVFTLMTASAQDYFEVRRGASSNALLIRHTLGGAAKTFGPTGLSYTGWFHLAITASKSADEAKVYLNGVQNGSTLTGLGVSSGNALISTASVIGAENTVPSNIWYGHLAHPAIWNSALSGEAIYYLHLMAGA